MSGTKVEEPDTLRWRMLEAELKPALWAYLKKEDPGVSSSPETQSMETLRKVGDLIMGEARSFFAPYADTAIANKYSARWKYPEHIMPTPTPTFMDRVSYLMNRAQMVGSQEEEPTGVAGGQEEKPAEVVGGQRKKSGTSIFSRHGYKSDRDEAKLERFVGEKMLREPGIGPIVDRHILYFPRLEPERGPTIYVQPKYQLPKFLECILRWKSIFRLSHELVHVLEHEKFTEQREEVEFKLLVQEGFTEVLGVQLYDHVRQKAINDRGFRAKLEEGLPMTYDKPPEKTVEYGAAGPRAEEIRREVGDDNFRAAYFLGAVKLVGLEKEKKP